MEPRRPTSPRPRPGDENDNYDGRADGVEIGGVAVIVCDRADYSAVPTPSLLKPPRKDVVPDSTKPEGAHVPAHDATTSKATPTTAHLPSSFSSLDAKLTETPILDRLGHDGNADLEAYSHVALNDRKEIVDDVLYDDDAEDDDDDADEAARAAAAVALNGAGSAGSVTFLMNDSYESSSGSQSFDQRPSGSARAHSTPIGGNPNHF